MAQALYATELRHRIAQTPTIPLESVGSAVRTILVYADHPDHSTAVGARSSNCGGGVACPSHGQCQFGSSYAHHIETVRFATCYTGSSANSPCNPPLYPDPCCEIMDLDTDGDIDLDDFTLFHGALLGP